MIPVLNPASSAIAFTVSLVKPVFTKQRFVAAITSSFLICSIPIFGMKGTLFYFERSI